MHHERDLGRAYTCTFLLASSSRRRSTLRSNRTIFSTYHHSPVLTTAHARNPSQNRQRDRTRTPDTHITDRTPRYFRNALIVAGRGLPWNDSAPHSGRCSPGFSASRIVFRAHPPPGRSAQRWERFTVHIECITFLETTQPVSPAA